MFNPGTFLVLIIILIYIAFSLKSTAIMLLVFVMSVFYVISVISTVLRCREIRGHMHVPIEISEKGRENLVKISVINQGKRMIFRTKALIVVKDITRGKRKQYWKKLPVLHEGENEFVESIIFHEMGKYELQLKCLRIYDITGLMHVDIRIKDTGKLRVMPGMYEVSVVRTEATKNFYGEADTYDEWFPGYDNNEIFQLREYQRGDRLQNVHWKLTAKHEELIIKEHSLPRSCPVVLLLDYQSWGFGEEDLKSFLLWKLLPEDGDDAFEAALRANYVDLSKEEWDRYMESVKAAAFSQKNARRKICSFAMKCIVM